MDNQLWNPDTGEVFRTLGSSTSGYVVSFSPDGQTLASGSKDRTIRFGSISLTAHETSKFQF